MLINRVAVHCLNPLRWELSVCELEYDLAINVFHFTTSEFASTSALLAGH